MADEQQQVDILYEQTNKIMDSINLDKPVTTLNETDLLIKTLPKKFIDKHKETIIVEAKIRNILMDKIAMRHLRLIQNIKSELETSTEYYDQDVGTDKRLNYKEGFEEVMTELNEEIRKLLSNVNRDLITEDIEYD